MSTFDDSRSELLDISARLRHLHADLGAQPGAGRGDGEVGLLHLLEQCRVEGASVEEGEGFPLLPFGLPHPLPALLEHLEVEQLAEVLEVQCGQRPPPARRRGAPAAPLP